MAALTAASWTIVLKETSIKGTKKEVRGTMAIPGTDTYPTGGIPLPAIAKFGFYRQMDSLVLFGQASAITKYGTSFDKTNHTLQLYVSHDTAGVTTLPQDEEDSSGVPGARTWDWVAKGW